MSDRVTIPEPPIPWRALLGVTGALAAFGLAQGMSYPLFTLIMERQGMSPAMIGLSAAMMPIGLMLSASAVPYAVGILGARTVAISCALGGALLFLLVAWLQNGVAWFALRFLIGLVINPLYILGEVWALALAPPSRRGRVMGIFNTVMSIGYAAGPFALTLVGTVGWPPFLIAICGFLVCAGALAIATRGLGDFSGDDGEDSGSVPRFALAAPALFLAVAVSSATQGVAFSLLPIFGLGYGLAAATTALMLTVLSLGNILFQVPLGLMAERIGARGMSLICAVLTIGCMAALPISVVTPLVWPVLLVFGAVGYGIYTMATIELGNRFSGRALVTGNSAFALAWGLGGIVGAPVAGLSISLIGPIGLPIVIAVLCGLLLIFSIWRSRQRRAE